MDDAARLRFNVGWMRAMGVEPLTISRDKVELQLRVEEKHLQPFGLVHGGVFSGLIETACSVGAALAAPTGHTVVGVENHTSFLRSAREGNLMTRAIPVHCGRRAQLWQSEVLDEAQRVLATGRVRLFCLPMQAEQD